MSVVADLERIDHILDKIRERPDVAEITGYNDFSLKIFQDSLKRAIARYKSEAARVRKYYR